MLSLETDLVDPHPRSPLPISLRHPALLPLVSLAAFWALPFSPFLCMAAVARTRKARGTPRRLAVAGAVLCSAYTLALAVVFTVLSVSLFVP